jgi:hypothetical protein
MRPSSGPFVHHSHSKLRSLASVLSMKIDAAILTHHLCTIHIHLPGLIVKCVSLTEALSRQNVADESVSDI